LRISQGDAQDEDAAQYMEGGKVSYDQFHSNKKKNILRRRGT